ncbi:hypothetical protein [Phreatobacter sp.]|uniref:hypothetical protein n=1 Tax=Phreatobacter sp. TaxID=1966341 RepID=UPI003F70DC5A
MLTFLRNLQPLRSFKRSLTFLAGLPDSYDFTAVDIAQKQLVATWVHAYRAGVVLPFEQVGFQARSAEEEDGLLLYIFTLAGTTNKVVLEISAQDGRTCMASNLILHHRWTGFLYDGDPVWVESGRRFFEGHPATRGWQPTYNSHWFTVENIEARLAADGVPAEIDLLSLDIDGIDLHLWKALDSVSPRVLIAEFNSAVPSDLSLTVPYRPDFAYTDNEPGREMFRSASLAAYVAVSRAKGYRLVAVNRLGYNAIFLRNDVAADIFPEIEASVIDTLPDVAVTRAEHWPRLKDLAWETVGDAGRPVPHRQGEPATVG